MSTTMVETKNESRRNRAPSERRTELFHEIRTAAKEVARHRDLDGLLRVVCRELLPALTSSRREEIVSFEDPLRFVESCLRRTARSENRGEIDPHYLIGRIEALLDLCVIATDQLVAASVIERVKKNDQAIRVLCIISRGEDVRRADLAAAAGAESEQAFSNLLKWMEEAELIRRRTIGREKMIGLGSKGELVQGMLPQELTTRSQPVEQQYVSVRISPPTAAERSDVASSWELGGFTVKQEIAAGTERKMPDYQPTRRKARLETPEHEQLWIAQAA